MTASLAAVVFDFDGLILDTEWSIYERAAAAFGDHGHDLPVDVWGAVVGLTDGPGGWYDQLCDRLGVGLARADFDSVYASKPRADLDLLEPLPGVVALLDALHGAGVPTAIASGSSGEWLEGHLGRLGLRDRFDTVVGVDRVGGVGKPAPDVYLAACADLGAAPNRSVALEDSAHGTTAARAAGMAVVAVPSRLTRASAFDHADRVVGSLTEITVADLAALVA